MSEHKADQHKGSHTHSPGEMHTHPVVNNLKIAFILNFGFTIIELIGGLYTNSIAILSDAVHDFGDSIAIGLSLFHEKYSKKGRTEKYTYGYNRFSPLAALITAILLILASVLIMYGAIPRFFEPQPVKVNGMLWMAIAGIAFNGLAVLRLSNKERSHNQRAVMLHLLEDVFGWIAVLVGSVIIYYTKWYWIDPLLSVGISLFILFNAAKNLKAVITLFLQTSPEHLIQQEVIANLNSIPGVINVHDFHSWALDER